MRFFAYVLSLQTLSHYCNGFSSYSTKNFSLQHHTVDGRRSNPSSSLFATDGNINQQQEESANKVAVSIATSTASTFLTLGLLAMSASPSLAAPLTNPTVASSSSSSSSSFMVAGYSDSDFTDFSLPSYQEVSAAEINTNLKGGKLLFGEEASSASSTSSSDATVPDAAAAPVKKEPTAAELKAEKAAAKAAQKAAREAQQAAVEAAIAAK